MRVAWWTVIKSVFAQALEVPAEERLAWLRTQQDLSTEARCEVERLLAHADESGPLSSSWGREYGAVASTIKCGELLAERFEVLDLLGRGGMGEVFLVEDRELRERVAMKTVRPELAADPAVLRRLKAEVAAARKIRHENVCRVYDFHRVEKEGQPLAFLTMEALAGETLAARLMSGPVSLVQATDIARQIASGLDAIHKAGIVHRDLKPGNVFLLPGEPERVVITDFGLAHDTTIPITETLTRFGPDAVVGTPAYMAPEELRGQGASTLSDIHAFGVILFELATGRLPFPGQTPLAIALQRLEQSVPSPREFAPDLPSSWESATLACLQNDRTRRPCSAVEVWQLIEGSRRPRRAGILRRQVWIGAGTTVLAGMAVVMAWRGTHSPRVPIPAAERHYKLGMEYARGRSFASIKSALDEFGQAVTVDPEYGDAWAALADQYCIAANFSVVGSRQARAEAERCGRRALQLDGNLAMAHAALGYVLAIDLKRWRQAEPYFLRAMQLNPRDAMIRTRYAGYLGRVGRAQEAIRMAESAIDLDPATFRTNYQLAAELFRARAWERLRTHMLGVVKLHPAEVSAYLTLSRANEWLGRFGEAEDALTTAARLPDHENLDSFRITLLVAMGRKAEAQLLVAPLLESFRAEKLETNVMATVLATVGQREQVLEALEEGFRREDDSLLAVATNPYLDSLRTYPPYRAFLVKLGFGQ